MLESLYKPIDIASLVFFRIVGGGLITLEMLGQLLTSYRKAYTDTQFHFSYYGFEWLSPGPDWLIYLHFILNILLGIFITIGLKFRFSCFLLFFSSMSLFLMEKGIYINHTYLYSFTILLLGLTNANAALSWDSKRNPSLLKGTTKAYMLYLLVFMISVVYIFAGFAKLTDPDWMNAIPMKLWLASKSHYLIIGGLYRSEWLPYLISYGGMLFDLLVVPLMLIKKTRKYMFTIVIAFHFINAITFGIGTFPWVSLTMTSLFFSPASFRKLNIFKQRLPDFSQKAVSASNKLTNLFIITFTTFHIIMPLRPYLSQGPVRWTEEGHKFSWRMMLRSKAGYINYKIIDGESGNEWTENPFRYLSERQFNNMIGKPDMMLQFAQFLEKIYREKGYKNIQIFCENSISLNGRKYQAIIPPDLDLTLIKKGDRLKILPLKQDKYNPE